MKVFQIQKTMEGIEHLPHEPELNVIWWWCYRTPSEGWGREEFCGDPTVGPRSKVWTRGQKWKKRCQRWRAEEAPMRDNSEGGELDRVNDVRRR